MPTERNPVRRSSRAVKLTVVPLIAAAFIAGCGEEEAEETAYCVNAQDEVVDDELCEDEGRSGYFVYFGGLPFRGSTIGRGTRLTGGERIASTDRGAIASRGGFGGSARPGGVGRTVSGGGGVGSSAGS
jgi:hypothetical protein